MARSIADKIIDANRAGKEAQFESNGVTYTFDPEGLKAYIEAEGGNQEVSWDDVQDKPATFPPVIGTTADTAKAGNYQPTWGQVTGKPSAYPPAAHTHPTSDIDGVDLAAFKLAVNDLVAGTSTLEDVITALQMI